MHGCEKRPLCFEWASDSAKHLPGECFLARESAHSHCMPLHAGGRQGGGEEQRLQHALQALHLLCLQLGVLGLQRLVLLLQDAIRRSHDHPASKVCTIACMLLILLTGN